MSGGTVLETARTRLGELVADDAPFVLALLTSPSFLRHIGDRGVHDLDGARRYIADSAQASYARHGFGLWRATRREDGAAIGLCGLLRRPELPAPDLGFAFLETAQGQGYGRETAEAVLRHARAALGIGRVLAIVAEGNVASLAVLRHLGFADAGEHAPGVRLLAHAGRPADDAQRSRPPDCARPG
ncbi:GNAT family N-acetyltransferase [Coralloluteibacterium thermophilus]|uniref:GNAT family N-acetyltransferase n=1 Tax=Coralloluteibacterium thermophilum TaxID=2707049 RepID=A0ABV9NND8_9GAMM